MKSGFDAFARRVNPALARFLRTTDRDLRFVRGHGCSLWDDQGRRWEDWYAGFGALALGHNPPALLEAARAQLSTGAPGLYLEQLNPGAGRLAEALVAAAGPPFETCLFTTSGAEAVETALKVAMMATGRHRVAYAAGGFHGLTLGALGAMAPGPYRDPFAPALPELTEVPWCNLESVDRALAGRDVAAFLMEPIQMEVGFRRAEPFYLEGVRDACRRYGALFVLDEVQTGLGRTGLPFRFQESGVAPDLLVIAKALGGGIVPIGAVVLAEGLHRATSSGGAGCDVLSGTYGASALGCAVGLAAVEHLTDPSFLEEVRARSARLFRLLSDAIGNCLLVRTAGVTGLLGGIMLQQPDHPWLSFEGLGVPELSGRPSMGPLLVDRLHRAGILAQVCGHDWNVVRIQPPLVVDDTGCDRFAAALHDGLKTLEAMAA